MLGGAAVSRQLLERAQVCAYNLVVMAKSTWLCTLAFLALVVASSAGCTKKSASSGESDQNGYQDITKTFDDTEPPPEDRKPVENEKVAELPDADKARFERLVDTLPSPCGKAHSLRTSANNDAECLRSRYAVDFVVSLLADGATDDELRELYSLRYSGDSTKRGFKLSESVPHIGPSDASVVLVEFFDYGCPACKEVSPQIKEVLDAFPRDTVLYFKQYPLPSHEDSKGAAQAALAAAQQGKYMEMHELLFKNAHSHKKDDLFGYAKELGLDMAKFESDYDAAEGQVNADIQEGNSAGVNSTPTLFINGRQYDGPLWSKYLKMWVEEELAVNR